MSTFQGFAGRDWINNSHFHELNESEVLDEVRRRVTEVRASALPGAPESHPLVLLDLDSTLYEVGHRTFKILQEWAQSAESARFAQVRERMTRLRLSDVGYSIKDTFSALGLSPADPEIHQARDSAKSFWAKRFFTNEYLAYDHAYPGAAAFARKLHEAGAEIVYLTGRDEPGMGKGTRANLIRDGFPWEVERTHLLLKPRFEMEDLAHKQNAADFVRKSGTLVASFENEPLNLVALYRLFPDAMHIFMETIWSDREAHPCKGLYRIRGFAV